jgi:hypothetical protein
MTDELEPLSPRLAQLLQKEQQAQSAIPHRAEERLLTMLRAASVPVPTDGAGDASPAAPAPAELSAPLSASQAVWPVSKSLLVALATGVVGFGSGLTVAPLLREPVPVVAPPAPAPVIEPAEPAAPDASTAAPEAPPSEPPASDALPAKPSKRVPRAPVAPAMPAPEPSPASPAAPEPERKVEEARNDAPDVQHASERQLIDAARVALGRGRSHDALVFLMGHERRFAAGSFVEEREFLVVQALLAQGRGPQARARGKAFLARFPNSTHAPRVRETIAGP